MTLRNSWGLLWVVKGRGEEMTQENNLRKDDCQWPNCDCQWSSCLGDNFTDEEKAAFDWLWERVFKPWTVDLATKEVTTPEGKHSDLIAYAKEKGMR